jgi:hypothetical protein
MEPTLYGAGVDPWPYITACYAIGASLIFGFAAWTIRDRAKLRALAKAVAASPRSASR